MSISSLQLRKWSNTSGMLLILGATLFSSCQSSEQPQDEVAAVNQQVAAPDTAQLRPAPEFYIIPPGMERKRVWVCDDNRATDVFHVDNTCELLKNCTGTFKNVSLQRAIEDYGRYNCPVCSKDLADIFDENKVR